MTAGNRPVMFNIKKFYYGRKSKYYSKKAELEVYKDGSFHRIDTLNFRPGEYPEFTKFLEQNFSLEQVHSNTKKKSGFYLVKVDPNKREDLLNILSNGLGSTVDLNSPCIYTGTKD